LTSLLTYHDPIILLLGSSELSSLRSRNHPGLPPILLPKNALHVDLKSYTWENLDLIYDHQLECFYLKGNLVYFSRSALPPDNPKNVYIGEEFVFRDTWQELPLARTWKLILVDQENCFKTLRLLKGRKPLPLQHHESYPPKYYYDPTARLTYHVTESAQAILCEQTHPFTQLVDISPLRRLTFLDLIAEHQHPGTQTLPKEFSRWRFTRLESHTSPIPPNKKLLSTSLTLQKSNINRPFYLLKKNHIQIQTQIPIQILITWLGTKKVKLNPPLEFFRICRQSLRLLTSGRTIPNL